MRPDPDTLFFLVGSGRCGSTLLQAMLSSHPRLYVPPELRYFGRHDPIAAFSDPLRDADVEAYLATCASDPWWGDMGLDRAAFETAVRRGSRASREIYLWVLGHVAEKRGNRKPRFGEKTPSYALNGLRIHELFPKARFIHLYRDPRDVTASYLEQYWCTKCTALGCARYIGLVYSHMEQLAARVGPERYCEVKYETLVEDPRGQLERLCGFLGEDFDPAMLQYGDQAKSAYLAVEESWKGLTRKPVTASRIGRHAERLTPRQVWTVDRALGPQLARHGYQRRSPDPGPLGWRAAYLAERIGRRGLRTLRIPLPLLDERAVLARRDELLDRDAAAGGAARSSL